MPTSLVIFLVIVAGVFGLLIGSFLNVVAYRVPAKVSLMRESRCPHCDTAIKPWHNVPVLGWIALRGRCANCKAPISPRYPIVEAITGLAFALITWVGLAYPAVLGASTSSTTGSGIALALIIVAFLYFAAISIVLTLIDLDTHRLPNAIVLPSYLVAGILFTTAAALTGDWGSLLRAAIGMAVLYAFYAILRLARPGGMGGGDVKLAGVVGIHLGWIGWGALAVGAFAAFLYGGLF
ncbi:MAG: prepilin peptidase, partial [Microbacterium sp.]|uniref:prepilin peptidase n=1 Tax=Microbacterium sp. TaxID=51671 RepID=UPI003F7E0EB6